ncbi:hypothetical protein PVK06_029688 [Gossypium arboreum]|uniref:Reverse transcriptase n=1 Tax=Gossypium arboreum TaxID=29729 RepID=A0ABR0NME0_GOSAR|nr:hypothetical protein PVK06_029688 [Gossypium arboreum]
MAVKIDLEKAYDKVHWDFIRASFKDARIPDMLISVIISVISSSTMQLLWNGVPMQKFKPTRGIWQRYNLEAVKIIQDSSLTSSNSVLIRHIHILLVNVELWIIQHVPEDRNKVIDCLAKMTFDTNNGLKIFEVILREVLALLLFKHIIVLLKELLCS